VLKKNLGKYLDYVNGNNEVVITKNGEKSVRMTPYLSDYDRYYLMQAREQALDYRYGGKKVSYEEFMDISEKSELRMEYIDGEIILLSSPSVKHQEISGCLHIIFSQFLKGRSVRCFTLSMFVFTSRNSKIRMNDILIACRL